MITPDGNSNSTTLRDWFYNLSRPQAGILGGVAGYVIGLISGPFLRLLLSVGVIVLFGFLGRHLEKKFESRLGFNWSNCHNSRVYLYGAIPEDAREHHRSDHFKLVKVCVCDSGRPSHLSSTRFPSCITHTPRGRWKWIVTILKTNCNYYSIIG